MKGNNRERGCSYLEAWQNEGRRLRKFESEDFLDGGLQDGSVDENREEERHLECSPEKKRFIFSETKLTNYLVTYFSRS